MGYDLIGTVHSGSKRWWTIIVYLTFWGEVQEVTRGPLHAAAESRAPFPSQAQGFDLTFQQ
jgi:hypothetical protein